MIGPAMPTLNSTGSTTKVTVREYNDAGKMIKETITEYGNSYAWPTATPMWPYRNPWIYGSAGVSASSLTQSDHVNMSEGNINGLR